VKRPGAQLEVWVPNAGVNGNGGRADAVHGKRVWEVKTARWHADPVRKKLAIDQLAAYVEHLVPGPGARGTAYPLDTVPYQRGQLVVQSYGDRGMLWSYYRAVQTPRVPAPRWRTAVVVRSAPDHAWSWDDARDGIDWDLVLGCGEPLARVAVSAAVPTLVDHWWHPKWRPVTVVATFQDDGTAHATHRSRTPSSAARCTAGRCTAAGRTSCGSPGSSSRGCWALPTVCTPTPASPPSTGTPRTRTPARGSVPRASPGGNVT